MNYHVDNSGEISCSDISNHPFQSLGKTIMNPVSKSLYGVTAEQVANAISQSPDMYKGDYGGGKPYDKGLNRYGLWLWQ